MEKKYFLGLDIGTDSVGWAVTDENFKLLKLKGKTAWGARIFDGASDAKSRRSKRSMRRRMARRRYRIYLLNEYVFGKEIEKIDPTFFLRLSESNLLFDDKSEKARLKYPLFENKTKEKEFFKLYPTIYHLRKAQIENDPKSFSDIRYLYLSVHHIIKKRGNFLTEGTYDPNKPVTFEMVDEVNDTLKSFIIGNLDDNSDDFDETIIDMSKIETIRKILNSDKKDKNKKDMQKEIVSLFKKGNDIFDGKEDQKSWDDLIDLFAKVLTGGTKTIKDNNGNEASFDFNRNYEESRPEYENILGENIVLLDMAKSIYDAQYIKELLGDEKYISYAMIKAFNSHKEDLLNLKKLIRLIDSDSTLYKKVFSRIDSNYGVAYEKGTVPSYAYFIDCPGRYEYKKVKGYSGFLNHLKDYVNSISSTDNPKTNELILTIKERIEKGEYLKRISDINGSGFPHQLHELELDAILKNAREHFQFLDEDMISKIKSIFLYKLNYFDGPLNTESPYSNVVKKDKYAKVFPWNKNEIIDKEKTNQKFIENLINYCTYLRGEKVLPKTSVLFNDFNNLNKLNCLVINGDRINHEVKLALFDFINLRNKTTLKQIEKFLKEHYENYSKDGVTISGIDVEGGANFISPIRPILSNYFDLNDKEVCEQVDDKIIKSLTIYAGDKKSAIKAIRKVMPNLTEEQEKAISRLNCKDWATMSRKFLTYKYPDKNGVVTSSIIDLLKDEELNLQQILNDGRFDIQNEIIRINNNKLGKTTKRKQIKDIIEAAPPMMCRPAIQAFKIAYEIKKIVGCNPEKIMVEVTRTNKAEKKRTKSRKEQIEELIKPILKDKDVLYKNAALEVKKELDSLEDELKLKSESIYLWFIQLGFDMYNFERISLQDVLKSDKYDIDHIVPQSLIKDDSLDNKVLVNKDVNEKVKKDVYPLNPEIISKCLPLWKYLREKNLISEKKYNALVRRSELTDAEINDFIQRQINVTNYSNKLVREIFKIAFPDTKIIFQKAENASFVRNEYNIVKVRELNDTHHAVDAYLNVVVGDILDKHYSLRNIKAREKVIKLATTDEEKQKITCNPESAIRYYFRHNEDGLRLVQNTCEKQDILLTRREKYHDGAFYGQTINKAGSGNELYPIHTNNSMKKIDIYGGYDSLATSHFLVATSKKNSDEKVLVAVPIIFEKLDDKTLYDELVTLYKKEIDLSNYQLDFGLKLYNQTSVIYKNGTYLLQSANKKQIKLISFMPFFLNDKKRKYLRTIIRLKDEVANKLNEMNLQQDSIEIVRNKFGDKDIISKQMNEELRQAILNEISLEKYKGLNKIVSIFDSEKDSGLLASNFVELRLDEQIERLLKSIDMLNRSSGWYLLAKNVFVKSSPEIVKTSVTGLFEKKIKL